MDVMDKFNFLTVPDAELFKHRHRLPHIPAAVNIYAGWSAFSRPRGRGLIAIPAIAVDLAPYVLKTLFDPTVDLFAELGEIPAVRVGVNRNTRPDLSAEQVVNRHVRHLALNIPEGHIDTGYGVILNRPASPVAVLVHQLP